jgi:hypothetical protein
MLYVASWRAVAAIREGDLPHVDEVDADALQATSGSNTSFDQHTHDRPCRAILAPCQSPPVDVTSV